MITLLFSVLITQQIFGNDYKSVIHERDTAIIFRFVPERLMFYSPFLDNEPAIREAVDFIDSHRDEICSGKAYIVIRGYCSSYPTEEANRAAAKNRTNQVKSYFITLHGMKEDYYRTKNYTTAYKGQKDIVAIIGLEYVEGYEPEDITVPESIPAETSADETLTPETIEEDAEEADIENTEELMEEDTGETDMTVENETGTGESEEKIVQDAAAENEAPDATGTIAAEPETAKTEVVANTEVTKIYVESPWVLKTNLLYDCLLSPSLEIEYRINEKWSVALEGNVSWWSRDSKHKYYQLANVSPEARYWFKTSEPYHGHYLGAFIGGGLYDLENGYRGYQGEGGYAGISYGYVFPIGKVLSLEAGVGVGYMYTRYREYIPIDQCYVYQQTSALNYFGPLKLKLALAWRIGYKKGGAR